jgi:transcriptional regulator with XRE-family HTH domain
MPPGDLSIKPFAEELPRLLKERRITLRALAREVGGFDHAYLSRMLAGKAAPNAEHLVRISTYLSLRPDYFPEVRTARLIQAIREDPKLRDELYFKLPQKPRRSGAG